MVRGMRVSERLGRVAVGVAAWGALALIVLPIVLVIWVLRKLFWNKTDGGTTT